jgi:uncharacterized protein YegJ (DUF2314 family)
MSSAPNKALEPTRVGAFGSAIAVHVYLSRVAQLLSRPLDRTTMNQASRTALVLIVLFTLFAACANRDKGYVEDSDPEMAAAIARAQATLPQFWHAFDTREHGESNFVLVVRITHQGHIEHFYTSDFERRDGKTRVTISNAPKIVTSVKSGDRIEIPPLDITDWSYMRDGKYVGMRTMKPRFKYMPADQVEAFKRVMTDP